MEDAADATALGEIAGMESGPGAETVLRGLARYDSGDWAGALSDFRTVLESMPDNPVARLHCGLAAWRTGDAASALAAFRAAHPFPHHGFVLRFLEAFWPLRFEIEELRAFMPREDAPPEPALVAQARTVSDERRARFAAKLNQAGMAAIERRQYALATAYARASVELTPLDEDSVALFAALSLQAGHHAEARAACERFVGHLLDTGAESQGEPQLPDSMLVSFWAMSLHEAGEHRAALAVLSRIRPEGPEDYRANLVAGLCWMMLGEKANAHDCLDAGLREFFLDSWELVVEPFIHRTMQWLETGQEAGGNRPAENSSS